MELFHSLFLHQLDRPPVLLLHLRIVLQHQVVQLQQEPNDDRQGLLDLFRKVDVLSQKVVKIIFEGPYDVRPLWLSTFLQLLHQDVPVILKNVLKST